MDPDFVERLPELALFVAAADASNLSDAARETGIPVARLSRRLAALEQAVGVRLIDRTPRRFGLTEDGRAFVAALRESVLGLDEAYAALVNQRGAPRGTLRLSASPDFAAPFLAPIITEYVALYPEVTIDLDLSPRRVDIAAERFDAAIRVGPLADSPLTSRRLATVPCFLYAAPAYLAAHGTPAHPADLADHHCLPLPHMNGVGRLTRAGERYDAVMRGPVRANNLIVLRRLCGEGLGIAALNALIATDGGEHCPVVPVLADWQLEPTRFYFLTPGRLLPARTRAFFDLARARLEARGY
jgi:DNA-binding transcriptional LysR family regulator